MTTDVDICNLSLAHLGDSATVTSLTPPEGSAQAEHCSRFYPIARDSLLEQHDWKFNTRRVTGALLTEAPLIGWLYAYAMPANVMRVLAVVPPLSTGLDPSFNIPGYTTNADPYSVQEPTAQPFAVEILADGTQVIYTNQPDAIIIHTIRITDSGQFSPLFVDTLSWYLASYMAGPIIKGDVGAAEAKRCLQVAMTLMGKATMSDARNNQETQNHTVSWIKNR